MPKANHTAWPKVEEIAAASSENTVTRDTIATPAAGNT
jgi:hypothetical protein